MTLYVTSLYLHFCPSEEGSCFEERGREEGTGQEGPETEDHPESQTVHGEKSYPYQEATATLPATLTEKTTNKEAAKQENHTHHHTHFKGQCVAKLTKSAYSKRDKSQVKSPEKRSPAANKSKNDTKSHINLVQSSGQSSTPPPVPPVPSNIQAVAEAAKDLPPPPAPPSPPPSQPPLPPPPPSLEPAKPVKPVSEAKTTQKTKSEPPSGKSKQKRSTEASKTSGGVGGINLNAIISARQKLKPSSFGKAIESGEVTDTSAEVACLIRSGAKAANSSLTKDAASFLRKRFEHIKEVTGQSDTDDSENEEWD